MPTKIDRSLTYRVLSSGLIAPLGVSAMLVLLYAIWHASQGFSPYGISPEVTLPSILLSGWILEQGLMMFSRGTPLPMSPQYFSALGISLLLFLVVGPTLLVFTIRRMFVKQSPVLPDFMTLGAIVVGLWWMVPSGAAVVFENSKSESLRDNFRIQLMRDEIIDQLSEIRYDAAVFAALPESKGGGGGTLRSYRLPTRLRTPLKADFNLEHIGEDIRIRATIRSDAWNIWGGTMNDVPTHASIAATIRAAGTITEWKWEGI